MKRLLKKLALALLLALVGTAAYQIWEFVAFYNRVRDNLEVTLDRFKDLGRAEFVRQLIIGEEKLGVKLDPTDITIQEDRTKGMVRVEFEYTRDLQILIFSVERRVLVWRTLRDVDFS